jgi:hypothetical protein
MRAGDSLSAGLVWIGAQTAMSSRTFIAINVGLTLAWLGLAVLLGRMYATREPAANGVDGSDVVRNVQPETA